MKEPQIKRLLAEKQNRLDKKDADSRFSTSSGLAF
jgi:hypothetical protein